MQTEQLPIFTKRTNIVHEIVPTFFVCEGVVEENLFSFLQKFHKMLSCSPCLGKPQKKVPPLMARPLRGGGGKGRALKEKGTFFLLPFKNYFTLDNLSKYGHITLKFIGRYFIWVVTIFSKKNRAILVQKLWGEKNCQIPFPTILRLKKFRWPLSSRGGGG